MKRTTYRAAPAYIRGAIRQAADRWQTTDGLPLGELLDGEVPVGKYAHDTRCPAHGVQRWAGVDECGPCDYLSRTDALEPPTDEACPDCRAEVGVPCAWACSSNWDAPRVN